MQMILRYLAAACLAVMLALPVFAQAIETQNYEADAQQGSGNPPTIPHKVRDDADGNLCDSCHRKGLKGTPRTPHPERLGCTQCHVRSDIGDPLPPSKKGKGKK